MNAQVLVLNANYEPLDICNTRRAVGLIISGKAGMVMNGRGTIQTVCMVFPRPSVIRLEKMIHRPRPRLKLSRNEIFRRDNYTCQYCGRQTRDLTLDHIIPRHLGGLHTWNNVVTACPSCNHHKGGRVLNEANMRLLCTPHEPSASLYYLFDQHLQANQEWKQYIEGW